MVVASDVKNIDHMLLIPTGCTLTERQISILQAWGVSEIEVQDSALADDTTSVAKLPPEVIARLTSEIRGRFFKPDDTNPVFAEIFKLMLQRRTRKFTAKSS